MGASQEDKFDHPTQKPLELMRRPIVNHLKRGGCVYDPFLGSGTTLIAAEATDRVCLGMELDPKYVDVIVERWQKVSGKEAKLDGGDKSFGDVQLQRNRTSAKSAEPAAPLNDGRVRQFEKGRAKRVRNQEPTNRKAA